MTEHEIKKNTEPWRHRLLVSVATEGWVRYEWHAAMMGRVTPVNWSSSGLDLNYTAMGYSIDDAYNLITKHLLERDIEWLITIEDDVVVPQNLFVKLGEYINEKKYPVVSGLYYTKSQPAEPLLFRGRGNSFYGDWDLGDVVMVDGLPMGCLLLHASILRHMWDNHAEDYQACDGTPLRRVFETPKKQWLDPEAGGWQKKEGTQDLYFFDRVLEHNVLEKTGWTELAGVEYPFVCDTGIACKHIDRNTGRQYP